ncbi:MAG TPA: two-component regulator propeller domain-containing protein, partial [Nitrosomonas sp.]|nr:two-component regulator propeller domain-containing protein [Nitrosomonas sp.]
MPKRFELATTTMRKRPFFKIVGLLFIIPAIAVFGQSVEFKSQHFSADNGLPHSYILDIYQDHQGFLWFATAKGLAKYDGYKFKTFLPEKNNIPSYFVNQICEDRYGNLWLAIGTGDLTKYDPRTNRFFRFKLMESDSTRFARNPNGWYSYRLFIDSFDNIWIAIENDHIARFSINSEKLIHYHHDARNNASISHDTTIVSWNVPHPLTPIIEDVNGNVWIGTLRGLNLYNRASDDFIHASKTFLQSGMLDTARVMSLFEDSNKRLWISTWGQGVFRFDHRTKTLLHYSHTNSTHCRVPSDSCAFIFQDSMNRLWALTNRGLSYFDTEHENFVLIDSRDESTGKNRQLVPFYSDKDGNVWTAFGSEIFLVNGETHQIRKYADNVSTQKSLKQGLIAFYEDSFNSLWFSKSFRGVVKLNPSSRSFEHILAPVDNKKQKPAIYGIAKSKRYPSRLWVGTSNGLMQYDLVHQKLSYIQDTILDTMLSKGRYFYQIPNVVEDKENSLWIAAYGSGLIRVSGTGKHVQYLPDDNDSTSISSYNIWCVFQDSHNMVWIGAHSGLSSYDPVRNSFIRYSSADGSGPTPDVAVFCFSEDKKNRVWVGTTEGLYCYDREKNTFSHYLNNLDLMTLFFDSRGRLWVGAGTRGLGLFDYKTGTVKLFTHPQGIKYDKVNFILEDDHGFLWCATEAGGLLKFDPQSERFIVFTEQHGLPSNCLHV